MEKELWIRADIPEDREERKELVISALESGVDIALVRPEDSDFEEFGKRSEEHTSEPPVTAPSLSRMPSSA